MIEVTLPWPPKELSPNARLYWAVVARAKKAYRTECFMQMRIAGATTKSFPAGAKLAVVLQFVPPDRRHRDQDNMLAAMKSGLDGIADCLGIDDRNFKTTFDVSDSVGGMVKVTISEVA